MRKATPDSREPEVLSISKAYCRRKRGMAELRPGKDLILSGKVHKFLRKMLTAKADTTFNLECPGLTFAVRKDVIETVFKIKPGIFIVINFARIDDSRGMLFAGWGSYYH